MGIKSSPLMDDLAGGRILVAEDEILIALDLSSMLTDAGAEVVGPATTLRSAKAIAQSDLLTAAIFGMFALAERRPTALPPFSRSGKSLCLLYWCENLPADLQARWPNSTVKLKPARQTALIAAIARLFDPK